MYQDTTGRLLNHSKSFQVQKVASLLTEALSLLIVGVVVASTGMVLLGKVTIESRVLSRWCGIALIAGSPPGVAILFLFSTPLVMAGILPGEIGWTLAGIPWMVVGYALFRVAKLLREQPSRVQVKG